MATSAEQIVNLALSRIGHRQPIDDLDEDTEAAAMATVAYELSRDAVLEEFRWPFATKRATLALLASETLDDWSYIYALPTDCLVPQFIDPGVSMPARNQRIAFALEYYESTEREVVLTNQEDAILVYTFKAENVTLFTPLFVQALAWKMAAEFALALAVKPAVGVAMEEKYQEALAKAVSSAMNQQQLDVEPDSEFVRGR